MDNISPEVLIYLQNVKNYFETNKEAREFFLDNSNEELFYKHMTEIAQKNFEKNGDATLDREQFELLRRTVKALNVVVDKKRFIRPEENIDITIGHNSNIFIEYPNMGSICLN